MLRTGPVTWRIGVLGGVAVLAGGVLVAGIGGGSLLAQAHTDPRPTPAQAVSDAQEALATNAAAIAAVKGGEGEDYKAGGVVVDPNGWRHVHVNRTYKGLEVVGGDAILHSDGKGKVRGATVNLKAPIVLNTKPAVSAKTATAIAAAKFRGTKQKATPKLVVDTVRSTPKLAWRVVVDGIAPDQSPSHLNVFVDARTGKVRRAFDTFKTADGTGHGYHVGDVQIGTSQNAEGKFQLKDPARGNGETRDSGDKFAETPATTAAILSPDNIFGNGQTTNRATVGVDAHYGVQKTWDYFKDTHGRNGIAGDGKGATSYVHYGKNYENAGWDDACFCMVYGDGSDTMKPFTAIDVAGHEMAHGVTSATANLEYESESGGLNEATSDIFGTLVEFYANSPADKPDYLIGEKIDIFGNGQPLRYMDDPKKDGFSYSCWTSAVGNDDVHYSSGVGNKFFYSLAVGTGKSEYGDSPVCGNAPAVAGIGNEKAGKIWYRALTAYMISTTDYAGARIATLKAAKDLFGAQSTEYKTVNAAWKAVAVVGDDPFPDPAQLPTVTSPGDQAAQVGKAVSLQIAAADPQNGALTYSASGLPGGLAINPTSGLITGTPKKEGAFTSTVTVKDPDGNAASATFKWTVAPGAGPCDKAQIVANPGFESGTTPWTETPAGLVRDGTTAQPAHGGTKLALLGGHGAAATDTITQQISIPAACTKARLKFHLHVDTTETATTAKDRFTVTVGDKQFGFWSNKDAATGYTLRQFNLAAFAGQTVPLTFKAVENPSNATTFVLDDVTIDVATDATPAPDGVPTPDNAEYTVKLKSDATGANWEGTEKVVFSNTSTAPLSEVYLRLWDNFHGTCPGDTPIKVTKVEGGTADALTVDCTALKITLPAPLAKGKRATIKFDLSIAVPDGADRFGRNGPYAYIGNALPVLAVHDDEGWHLDPYTNNGESFYSLASDYTVILDHPSTIKVPATGTPVDVQGQPGRTITTVTAKKVREFAWAAGPFSLSTTTSATGIKVNTYWTAGISAPQATSIQTISSKSLDAHSKRFGAYPYGEQDVIVDNQFWFGGMEYPGLVLDLPNSVAAVHELAHQWWYGIVGNDEYSDPWLDESFADYATDLYFGSTGANCRITWASPDEKLSNSMEYWDKHDSRYGSVIYSYGKCALHDLRRVLGDAAMEKLLADYAKSHWYGVSTTASFKEAAQEVASALPKPVDLTSFWASHRIEG